MSLLFHERQVRVMGHRGGGNRVHQRIGAGAVEADIVINRNRTVGSEPAACTVGGAIVKGVFLDAGRARDPQDPGSAAEKHVQGGRAGNGTGEREEIAAAVIGVIEGGVVEGPSGVLCLDLHEGIATSGNVAQSYGTVFEVSATEGNDSRSRRVVAGSG